MHYLINEGDEHRLRILIYMYTVLHLYIIPIYKIIQYELLIPVFVRH